MIAYGPALLSPLPSRASARRAGIRRGRPSAGPAKADPRRRLSHRPQPSEIGAQDVIAYLRQHPDFLERHPEALRLVRPPSRKTGDGVLDFQHFMLERLRHDVVRLQDEQKSLIATEPRQPREPMPRAQGRRRRCCGPTSFEHLLQIVTTDLAVLIDVDVVTLGVESTAARMTRLPVHGIHLLRSGTVDAAARARPRRTAVRATSRPTRRCSAAAAGLVRSQALLRLSISRSGPIGLMCIGTRKPDTFHPGLGTELLTLSRPRPRDHDRPVARTRPVNSRRQATSRALAGKPAAAGAVRGGRRSARGDRSVGRLARGRASRLGAYHRRLRARPRVLSRLSDRASGSSCRASPRSTRCGPPISAPISPVALERPRSSAARWREACRCCAASCAFCSAAGSPRRARSRHCARPSCRPACQSR